MTKTPLVKPYSQLRAETAHRDRSLHDKVVTLEQAAALIKDVEHVAIGGCMMSRTPSALIWALVRARRKNLTFSRSIVSSDGDIVFASGIANKVITSWFSQGIVWGISRVMRAWTEQGRAEFEEWSHMSMGLRYRAGAMGLPFMPTRSMMGSDVGRLHAGTVKDFVCPFTGEKLLLLPALNPDVAIIHVQRCDQFGNPQIDGLPFMDHDLALAAKRVILTTERIVSNDQIRRQPDQTAFPFFTVEAVAEAPFGSAPHECYGLYEPFFKHMDLFAEMTRADVEKGAADYLQRFYYEPKSWTEVLERMSLETVLTAVRGGRSIHDD
ncbi:MAG: CoA transferase subunit A [Rhodospirillales bacterium]|nr:CoA transferase subunit A [Rhodospirillales bacterium]